MSRLQSRFGVSFSASALYVLPSVDLESGHLVALCVAGLMVAAYGLVLHEQLADRPWFAGYLSIWHDAETALGVPLRPSASIARNQPWFELGRPLDMHFGDG